MKKVNFITKYISGGHAVRGVGFYSQRLLNAMISEASRYDIEIVSSPNPVPGCDLIHHPHFELFQKTLPIYNTTPTIVTILDVIPLEFPDVYKPGISGSLNFIGQKISLATTKRIITISNASAKSITKFLNIPSTKIDVIHLAADSVFQPVKSPKILQAIKLKYSLPDKFVLYVGGVNYNKNLSNLIHACKQLDYPLVIVGKEAIGLFNPTPKLTGPMDLFRSFIGKPHPQLAHIDKLKTDIKSANVVLTGFVPTVDLAAIYSLADVYCQPSLAEGFGLNVLEAIACGTPVAVSNTHSLPEIAGPHAHYFDPRSPKEISTAILHAAKSTPQPANPDFSWANTAKKTLESYQRSLQ